MFLRNEFGNNVEKNIKQVQDKEKYSSYLLFGSNMYGWSSYYTYFDNKFIICKRSKEKLYKNYLLQKFP